ncbi:MAG: hypothetical protein J7M19_07935 [Planctomycetes bacterium]|nr:hypothetical protein [Planctomycetota bacterium]
MASQGVVPEGFVGRDIVLDTNGPFVYIGRLKRADDFIFELEDVDVHDSTDSCTAKEVYIMDAKKFGVKKNRTSVFVLADRVVSLSLLEDVIDY